MPIMRKRVRCGRLRGSVDVRGVRQRMGPSGEEDMTEVQTRRRSPNHECRRCSLCVDSPHHFIESAKPWDDDEDEDEKWTPTMLNVAGEAALLWQCRHCPAWMETLGGDDDETDLDAAWEAAAEVSR